MLEQLFNLIKDNAQAEIINNPAIPNEQNNQAVGLATDSVFSGLQSMLGNGGIGSLLGLLGGQSKVGASNPLVNGIIKNFAGGLMSKFGITNPIAASIASSLIPKVLNKLVGRTSDPNDSGFNINGLIGSLMGQDRKADSQQGIEGFDFNNILNQLTGGNKAQPIQQPQNNSGGLDIGSLLKMVTGGQQQAPQQEQAGGGLMDIFSKITQGANQQQQQQQQGGGGLMDLLKGFM
jgi:hypothetical protein